jgi:hypothetical protein
MSQEGFNWSNTWGLFKITNLGVYAKKSRPGRIRTEIFQSTTHSIYRIPLSSCAQSIMLARYEELKAPIPPTTAAAQKKIVRS